jgi:hypothetical protein
LYFVVPDAQFSAALNLIENLENSPLAGA